MKRIISCLLAILLLMSVLIPTLAFAAEIDEPTFAVSSEEGNPGKNVSVTIRIDNNPGVASVKLKVDFDNDLILNSVEYNDTQLGGRSQQPEKLTSPVTLNWFNGDKNTIGDMTFAVLSFTVAENAAVGEHPITVTYDADDVFNTYEENIEFGIVNGCVNVTIPVTSLSLDKQSATVHTADGTFTLTPVFTPLNATNQNVSWRSSNTNIATVENGVVTIKKHGVVMITAVSEDGSFRTGCALTILCSHLNCDDVPAKAPDCTEAGNEAYTICRDCGTVISGSDTVIPPLGHSYSGPRWSWKSLDKVTATFLCTICRDLQTIDAAVTSEITNEPTFDEVGKRTYTASITFEGQTYKNIITVNIPKLYILGDVDSNSEVEIIDATWIQRHVAGKDMPFTSELGPSDIDRDGEITLIDSTMIQGYLAQMKNNYGIGEVIG